MEIKLYLTILLIIVVLAIEWLWRRKNAFNQEEAVAIGKLLFEEHAADFEILVGWFVKDKKQFELLYGELFDDMGMAVKDIRLLDLLRAFGIEREKILVIDWRGEENEGEIQKFCEEQIGRSIAWTHVQQLENISRTNTAGLFKAIQKDLIPNRYQLAFMDSGNDSYELMVLRMETFNAVQALNKKLIKANG